MKRLLLLSTLLLLVANFSYGQRFKFVDTDYILEQMPEYKSVQQEIEDLSAQWQKQIEEKQQAIKDKFEEYQAKRVLMNEQERSKMEEEIEQMERDLAKFRADKFGYEGELFKLREEKMRPIQERVVQAIEDVARGQRMDFIYDKSAAAGFMIYTNSAYDISDEVLKKLGITPQQGGGQ